MSEHEQQGGAATARTSGGASRASRGGPLYERFRSAQPSWVRLWMLWLALLIVALIAAWMYMRPAPPKRIVIVTSSRVGAYYKLAEEYSKTFAKNGVTLEVQESAGTVENYRRLAEGSGADGQNGASLAIVAGGQAPTGLSADFHSIASLYLEPVWVFYRGESDDRLTSLVGKRVAIGALGGGGRTLALLLLRAAGAIPEDAPTNDPATSPTTAPATGPARKTTLLPLGGRAAADALEAGEIDAAFLIAAPDSPVVAELLAAKASHGIKLLSFERHEAYARRFPFLSDVKLSHGVVDLAHDLPDRDVYLLAPAANLIARSDLHPALVPLLLSAVTTAPPMKGLLTTTDKFPNTDFGEFPIDPAAREYFRSGPPLLQRFLPFWLAAWLDRVKILLLPLITLLLPLARLAPPIYVWRIRARIYRWYRVLRHIDQRLRDIDIAKDAVGAASLKPELHLLDEMDSEVAGMDVPLAYMAEFYTMRQHADFLRQEIQRREAPADRSQSIPK